MVDQEHNTLTPPLENSSLESYTGAELPFRALYLAGIALAVTSVVFAVALIPMREAMISSADKRNADRIAPSVERPATSRLQQDPEANLQAYEALMANTVSTYGWQDKANGIVRIPLDRAIELALAEGLIASSPDAVEANFGGASGSHASADGHADDGQTSGEEAHEEPAH